MSELSPQTITDMSGVTSYWRQCLNELDEGKDEMSVASHMVGVVSNDNNERWSSGPDSHPAYPIVFDLAASLELPENFTGQREERWACVRALIGVLEERFQK